MPKDKGLEILSLCISCFIWGHYTHSTVDCREPKRKAEIAAGIQGSRNLNKDASSLAIDGFLEYDSDLGYVFRV